MTLWYVLSDVSVLVPRVEYVSPPDLQLDEDFRVWLIEVNTNPYLGVQNPWHGTIMSQQFEQGSTVTFCCAGDLLARMTEDCVRLAIDPVFPPPPGVPIPPTPKSVVAPIPMSPILTSAEGAEGGVPPSMWPFPLISRLHLL